MGRKKRRCRAWQRQMREKARSKQREYRGPYQDISPGRLVAWADFANDGADFANDGADFANDRPNFLCPDGLVKRGNGGYGNHAKLCDTRSNDRG